MAVDVPSRRKSKTEFENAYFKIHDDCINLIENNFGASKEKYEHEADYIKAMSSIVLKIIFEMGTHIKIANSIYPKYKSEHEARRVHQDNAIGLCFDLLMKYQLIMHKLKIKDDKYLQEIKNIGHEINCLKGWRESDYSRYKNLP